MDGGFLGLGTANRQMHWRVRHPAMQYVRWQVSVADAGKMELERDAAGIGDVVLRPPGDDRKSRLDFRR